MMAIYDGFFDATLNEETEKYEPSYDSDDFSEYFGQFIGSGVCIYQNASSMAVRFSEGAAIVSSGYLFIDGYWLKNDADYSITLTGAGTFAILAHLNLGTPAIELKAESKANPEVYPDSLVLAYVTVSGGSGTVEDTRHNTSICGVIDAVGSLSGKLEYALNYIDTEIEAKLEQAEADIEAQAAELDAKIAEVAGMVERLSPPPIGSIKFSAAEQGNEWLKCDGSFVSEDDYPELVAALGKLIPSGDKFSLISSGEIGPQISNGVLYNGRMWVYSHAAKKLYGVDVNGVQPVKEIPVTRNSAYKNFVSPTLEFPISLSIVPHSAYTEFNWAENNLPTNYDWSAVTYGGGKYVAVAKGSAVAAYSTDAENWDITSLPESADWSCVAYGNGVFSALASYWKNGAYSYDGVNWESTSTPNLSGWESLAFGDEMFFAVSTGGYSMSSKNGKEWNAAINRETDLNNYQLTFYDVAYSNGRFAVAAKRYRIYPASTDYYIYIFDGDTYSTRYGVSEMPMVIAYGNNRLVALLEGGKAYVKIDGDSAGKEVNLPFKGNWSSMTYGGGLFVAISDDGRVLCSEDGLSWKGSYLPDSQKAARIACSDTKFAVVSPTSYRNFSGSKTEVESGALVFLGQNLKEGPVSYSKEAWMDSFLLFQAELFDSAESVNLSLPFETVYDCNGTSRKNKSALIYVTSKEENGNYRYYSYIGEYVISWSMNGDAFNSVDSFNESASYKTYQRCGFSHKNKGECVVASFGPSVYYAIYSKLDGTFDFSLGAKLDNVLTQRSSYGPANVVGRDSVVACFTPKSFCILRRTAASEKASAVVNVPFKIPTSTTVFPDAGAYLWGKDMYMIFVGTGIIFSRTLEEGDFGYLDTTSVLGTITQFGYLDYSEDEGTLYLMGQDTSNQVKVAKMKLDTLFDYASNGAWLPTMSMDGIPAYIRVKEETTA